mmetsp:Transcript_64171/g.196285  ORF Transcript_64171/g.196285 Transcript_64171/m.196285 type:complete len:286 (+) Transcript_64171:1449-2306(+)
MPFKSTPKIGALAVSIRRDKSSAMRCCSAAMALICVMSCPTQITPITSLLGPRRVAALRSSTAFCSPSLTNGSSKLGVCSPFSAFSRTCPMDAFRSSVTNLETMGWPMASAHVNCASSASFRFHSVTWPWMSTPKMGALAVSMSRARSSAFLCCSSVISRIIVISWPTPITPVTWPSGPRRVVAFNRISLRLPSFVNRGNWKFAVSLPFNAAARTSCTDSLNSFVMKLDTKFLPMVSALLNPSKLEALAFHSETFPSVSMPKMGAFAVSIRRVRSSAMRFESAMT